MTRWPATSAVNDALFFMSLGNFPEKTMEPKTALLLGKDGQRPGCLIHLPHASVCLCCYSNMFCGVCFMQNATRPNKKTKSPPTVMGMGWMARAPASRTRSSRVNWLNIYPEKTTSQLPPRGFRKAGKHMILLIIR